MQFARLDMKVAAVRIHIAKIARNDMCSLETDHTSASWHGTNISKKSEGSLSRGQRQEERLVRKALSPTAANQP